MEDLTDAAVKALGKEGEVMVGQMRQEVGMTVDKGAPGRPEWREEIARGIAHVDTTITRDRIEMAFGNDPKNEAALVRAMVVGYGSSDKAEGGGTKIQTEEGSVKISGYKLAAGTTPQAGKFAVKHGTDAAPKTEIIFKTGDCEVGDQMRVTYRRNVIDASVTTVTTSNRTATGSLTVHWPVYRAGDDVKQSGVKGWLHMELPRVRVTAMPGFDPSYKSAATNSLTFSAVDPKGADDQIYSLTYEPLDGSGNIVTKPEETGGGNGG